MTPILQVSTQHIAHSIWDTAYSIWDIAWPALICAFFLPVGTKLHHVATLAFILTVLCGY